MENLIEPEEQTASDNFDVSDITTHATDPHSQSCWGKLNDDDENYLNKKGFHSPLDLLKSYRSLEKAYSAKFSIPKDDDEQAWHKLYSHLGMPNSSADFNINLANEDVPFGEAFKEVCWKNHVLPQSAQAIYDWFVENRAGQIADYHNDFMNKSFLEMKEQTAEWGAKADRNLEQMKRGIRLFAGDDDDTVDAMEQALGTKRMMQVFCKLGEAISEDNAVAFGRTSVKRDDADMAAFFKEMFHGL